MNAILKTLNSIADDHYNRASELDKLMRDGMKYYGNAYFETIEYASFSFAFERHVFIGKLIAKFVKLWL